MKEVRTFDCEIRVDRREKGGLIVGHAAVFDRLSENLGGFREKIAAGAFDDVLSDDVRGLFNHDSNLLLGRSRAGTLRLNIDQRGLGYEIDAPDTTAGRDLLVSLERGDVTQSSFGFTVADDTWAEDRDGTVIRTIRKLARLFDVSPVTFPAYPDTDVAKREFRDYLARTGSERARALQARTMQLLGPARWRQSALNHQLRK